MKKVLIFLENNYEKYAIDLLQAAEEMYAEESFYSSVFSVDADISAAEGKADEVIDVSGSDVQSYDIGSLTDIAEEIHRQEQYDCILILATHIGRMLAPRLAMRLGTGIVADVTEIHRREDGEIEMVRPAFSGKLMAGIVNVGAAPIMMSIRPGIFQYENAESRNTFRRFFSFSGKKDYGIRMLDKKPRPVSTDIRDSDVIVAGGGGILRNFDCLDELAGRIGGMKGASRKVVDSGAANRSIQVGQSGKVVHPKLYIAIGIYGALQHVAGLQKVEHLIAVNTNKDAPICSLADIVVEGDGTEFVNKLIKRIDSDET